MIGIDIIECAVHEHIAKYKKAEESKRAADFRTTEYRDFCNQSWAEFGALMCLQDLLYHYPSTSKKAERCKLEISELFRSDAVA